MKEGRCEVNEKLRKEEKDFQEAKSVCMCVYKEVK